MRAVKKTPNLRFPAFKQDWCIDSLFACGIDVIDGDRGKSYPNKSDFSDVGYCLFLSAKNVTKTGFRFIENQFISEQKDSALRKGKLERNDIVLTTRGSIGHKALYDNNVSFNNVRINSGMVILRNQDVKLDHYYLYSLLFSQSLTKQIDVISFGSAQPQLTVKEIKTLKVGYGSIEEQQKIADFLTSVNTKISQQTEKHRLLKEYKKGVMQQIFSQKIRFKDEDGKAFPEWVYEPIGKYLEPHKELVKADTDIPILTSSRTGLYLQERSVINEGDYGIVPLGYFTYRHMSDDLIFKFNVNRTWEKGAVSKEYPVFKTVGMDTYFLEVQLNEGNDFKQFAIQQKQGGTRTRLYFKNLKELKLKLPCLKEQQKISQFLQSIDAKIEGVAEQIEQTKQFKKGLLQQMFV
ncbi:restriction endonuclease subunit S [Photobacterium leiognathi]|uniref:restriction endonuclease subunit S n=1 Tax=Photobacterium leiognathi TaxID=553611 RepID=UPI002981B7A1|nr:restriction endonuclease subunit S [Photobacterium leiognathi]